jgi:hypothetical protein
MIALFMFDALPSTLRLFMFGNGIQFMTPLDSKERRIASL